MNNLRYALRQAAHRPGFSVVVILMLALGIGTTTAMFSLFHQILVQPLPVPEPERLVNLGAPGPKPGFQSSGIAGGIEQVFSYPMFRDLEARQTVFTGIAGHLDFSVNLSFAGEALAGRGMLVTSSYFSVLNLQPALGRLIGPQDAPRIDESAVVVLSHAYWQNYLGGNRDVIGRTLTVNGHPLTIVGITPAGFSGTTIGIRPDVFVPLTLGAQLNPTWPRAFYDERRAYWLYLFARLKPGMSVAQASAGINALYSGMLNEIEAPLNSALPDDVMERFLARQITLEPGARGQSIAPDTAGPPLTLLLATTTVLLLIVCVNIANLLLARGASRAGEMAIRASIGANRRQLVSQLLSEATVLAIVGGLASLPVAAIALDIIVAIAPAQVTNAMAIELSSTAMLFAAGASLSTLLLVGLIPAMLATRADPGLAMKRQASQSSSGRGTVGFRRTLATAQIAFSMVLLVLAGLFTQSLMNIARIDLGIAVDSLVTFTISPRLNGYSPERAMNLFDRIEEEFAAQPGVAGIASSTIPLITGRSFGSDVAVEGFESGPGVDTNARSNEVSPGFFRALSIPLLAGRGFIIADRLDSPRVAVVNERFVRKFNLGDDAVGTRFGLGDTTEPGIEIVGVVANAKYSEVKGEIPPQYFLPRRQNDNLGTLSFYVRADMEADGLVQMTPRILARIDPDLPVSDLMTMRTTVQNSVYLDRLVAILSAGFAGLATLLAAIGLYGVLAYSVTQRTRELGLRLALGATPVRLRAMVLEQAGLMALIGLPAGLAAAIILGRAAEALLYGLSGYEPAVLLAAGGVLSAVVLAAAYVPAHRASRVVPMEALRYE